MSNPGEGINLLLDEVLSGNQEHPPIRIKLGPIDPKKFARNLQKRLAQIEESERRGGWQDQQLAERSWVKD